MLYDATMATTRQIRVLRSELGRHLIPGQTAADCAVAPVPQTFVQAPPSPIRSQFRQGLYNSRGFKAHVDDLAQQPHDVFGVVGAVRVGADAAVLVLGHLVLVNDPFERAAIAEAVLKGFGRDAAERQRVVHFERAAVFGETHLWVRNVSVLVFLPDLVGERSSPVEIGQLNNRVIKAKKKDVTVRIIAMPLSKEDETDITGAFRPMKKDARLLFVHPHDDHRGRGDDRFDDGPGFTRWVIIDRREMLLATATADEGVLDLDSAVAIWVSNASIAQQMMRPLVFENLWETSEQIK